MAEQNQPAVDPSQSSRLAQQNALAGGQGGGGKTNVGSMLFLIAGVNLNLESAELLPMSSGIQMLAPDDCCCFFKTMSFNCGILDDFLAQLKEALNRGGEEFGMGGAFAAFDGVSVAPSQGDLVGQGILPPTGVPDDYIPQQQKSNER